MHIFTSLFFIDGNVAKRPKLDDEGHPGMMPPMPGPPPIGPQIPGMMPPMPMGMPMRGPMPHIGPMG